MKEQLEKIKTLLAERGMTQFEGSDLSNFIINWLPEGNADYQQEYFLMELKTVLQEIIILSLKPTNPHPITL